MRPKTSPTVSRVSSVRASEGMRERAIAVSAGPPNALANSSAISSATLRSRAFLFMVLTHLKKPRAALLAKEETNLQPARVVYCARSCGLHLLGLLWQIPELGFRHRQFFIWHFIVNRARKQFPESGRQTSPQATRSHCGLVIHDAMHTRRHRAGRVDYFVTERFTLAMRRRT